jgi:hypothetical protein
MTDSDIVAELRQRITLAQDAAPPAEHFKAALDYYYGRPRGDELPGRSQVQSLDVADMCHAVLAQIVPTFTNDTVCAFEPDAPNDEAQARLETDAVNKVMMESSRGFVELYSSVKDALLLKNGIVKVYLDEEDGRRYVRMSAVDPLNFVVDGDAECILLQYARLVAERKEYTRSQLLEMGFSRDKVEECQGDDFGLAQESDDARRYQGVKPPNTGVGWASEKVTVWECYAQMGEDGKTSLRRVLLSGNTLLLDEAADYIPYATGTAFIEPHKFWGLSLYDRLKTVQDAKTAIQRQWIDNLANCNNSRTVVNDSVNLEDYLNGRPGGAVRVKGIGPVGESIQPLPVLDAGPAAQAYLAYMDQVRADRGGAALQMASGEQQLAKAQIGSMGVDRMFSVQEQLAGMMARTLAETLFRSAFQLVHTVLRLEYGEPMTLRLADQWVQVEPAQWKPRVRINIKAGLSPGERSRKAASLAMIVQHQMSLWQAGADGVLVNLPNVYQAMLDWAYSSDIDGPEKYFTDPASQASQQAGQAKAQQSQAMQQMAQQLEMQKVQLEQQKLELDRYKHETELQFKKWEAALNAEIEEAKLIGAATADLQLEEARGRNQLAAAREGAVSGPAGAGGAGTGLAA